MTVGEGVAAAAGVAVALAVITWLAWSAVGIAGIYAEKRKRPTWGPLEAALETFMAVICRWWHRLPPPSPADPPALPPTGPALLVAPHRTSLDPFLIYDRSNRQIRFLVAKEFTRIPLIGTFLRLAGTIPVDRKAADVSAVKAALRVLKDGDVVGLFPEGGIIETGESAHVRHGAAMMALRTGVPVIPACIGGIRPSGRVFRGLIRRSPGARVVFGPPVDLSEFRGRRPGPAELEAATRKIMEAVNALAECLPPEARLPAHVPPMH
jgi:1-acyl-sn-glycerol-3-phosphate acyltransferase